VEIAELALKADAYKALREKRLELARQVTELKEKEQHMRRDLIVHLEESDVTGVQGKICFIALVPKCEPIVVSWGSLYTHIRDSGEFELLQRRVGVKAVKERWDDGLLVPGVEEVEYNDLSVRKPLT
jgi:hypothetical protein